MGICCSTPRKNNNDLEKNSNEITTPIEERLKHIKREHLTDFSFVNIKTIAKVVSVYDGDTVRVAFPYPPNNDNPEILMSSCRLSKIDTPELRTANDKEKEHAIKARDRLKELTMSTETQLVYVQFEKNDKYGRPLVTIFLDYSSVDNFDLSVNNQLVVENYARLYDGGKKEEWVFT